MKTILLDIGGVLTLDPWESICLTPRRGLAARLGVSVEAMFRAGTSLWSQFAVCARPEDEYWTAMGQIVESTICPQLVEEIIPDTLLVNPAAELIFDQSEVAAPGRVGIISDNTSFFFPRQALALELTNKVNSDLVYLSHVAGLRKRGEGEGLFEYAASQLDPAQTLILDDRQPNLERARAAGFRTHLVSWGSDNAELEHVMNF